MKLQYLGEDSWSRPVYKDEDGRLWKDTDLNSNRTKKVSKYSLCSSTNNDFEDEPDTPIAYIKKYQDVEIELLFDEVAPPSQYRFTYMMLGRLESDCKYYLGFGNRNEKDLWTGNVVDHIAEMKKRWNSLPNNAKPEWLTIEDIKNYEKEMQ